MLPIFIDNTNKMYKFNAFSSQDLYILLNLVYFIFHVKSRYVSQNILVCMSPASKKLLGHIALGLSVCLSVDHALGMSHNA